MNKRLQYRGGNQEQRMIRDKLNGLRKALLYSYQAQTIYLPDKNNNYTRKFRCLINPDKLKADYDNKILSIPYEDINLNNRPDKKTSMGRELTNIAPGQIFYWEEAKSYWIIYLQYKEEKAYFRADIRCCEKEVEINNHKYWVYYRGPVETTIPWNQKKGIVWNTPNYSAIIYITKNEETLNFFHRFNKIKIDNKPWEIKAVDESSGDGIIEVQLRETFKNSVQEELEAQQKELDNQSEIELPDYAPKIIGPTLVKPYDIIEYSIINADLDIGKWKLNTKKAIIKSEKDNKIKIEIITGRSGNFILNYQLNEEDCIGLPIEIQSL